MSSSIKHTRGPWEAVHCINRPHTIQIESPEGILAEVFGSSGENAANARLIAAAPDLLYMLRWLAYNAERSGADMGLALDVAKDTIAKATGENL